MSELRVLQDLSVKEAPIVTNSVAVLREILCIFVSVVNYVYRTA